MYPGFGGNEIGVADVEEELIEDAKKSLQETKELREEREAEEDSDGEPGAKTSSGDADSVTDDD